MNNIFINENDFDLAINLAAQAGVRVQKEKEYLYKHTQMLMVLNLFVLL
ncbi:MAG: hypothetical protein CM15mP19_00150 [Gammaproteobacteria bacterium]|nr:MAG: hypothetical protein CM15mP19_00150 [Gammaproteobacteria bacterium]